MGSLKTDSDTERSQLHSGHRERMRSKFIAAHELGMFTEVEVLEMLLYHSIPRANTNELAHRLIEKFGSLDDVLRQDMAALEASGLAGRSTAYLLSFIGSLCAYIQKGSDEPPLAIGDLASLKGYIKEQFEGFAEEALLLLPLDRNFRPIKKVMLRNGSRDRIRVDKALLLREVVPTGCSELIIAHNHPSGKCAPSANDEFVTRDIFDLLSELGITLTDHLIAGTDGVFSMRERGYFFGFEFRK